MKEAARVSEQQDDNEDMEEMGRKGKQVTRASQVVYKHSCLMPPLIMITSGDLTIFRQIVRAISV